MTGSLRCALLLACVCACGTTHRKARPDLAPADRGVAELSGLLRDFKTAVAEHRFGTAQEMLAELEEGIKKADMKTIAHPDYTDIAHAVDGGRAALAKARREWAITELIEATTRRLAEAEQFAHNLPVNLAKEPLDELEEALADLDKLAQRGEPFAGEVRYQAFRKPVDERRVELVALTQQSRWRLNARDAVADALDDYSETPPPAETSLDDQIRRSDQQVRQLEVCVATSGELSRRPGFAPELVIDTPLGPLTLEALEKACANRKAKTEQAGATLRWRREVERTLEPASAALQTVADQQALAARLEKSDKAIELLRASETRLAELAGAAGADPAALFTTSLGTSTLAKLTEKWKAELTRLAAAQPTWRWQIALAQLEQRAKEAKEKLAAAQKADADDRPEELNEALGGFAECSERADHLAAKGDSTWQGAQPSKAELKAVAAIGTACRAEAEKTRRLLAPPKPAEQRPTGKKPKSNRKRKR